MTATPPPAHQSLPQYIPGPDQLPASLRGTTNGCLFHYTEPWRALAIRADDLQFAKQLPNGSWGVFLTELTPGTHDSAALLRILFGGNVASSPRLWACIVYRAQPADPTGYPGIFPDPGHPHPGVLIAPTHRNGIWPVSQYLRAIGFAEPAQTGVQWAWWEP